jgi:hypothetical protein
MKMNLKKNLTFKENLGNLMGEHFYGGVFTGQMIMQKLILKMHK